jgi:hypothetical protein
MTLVENFFSRCKAIFRICHRTSRGNQSDQDSFVKAVELDEPSKSNE